MKKIHLWPEDVSYLGDHVIKVFRLEGLTSESQSVWYRLPKEFSSHITEWCDPFVVGSLFSAMSIPADLVVHGNVSPSLIFNLSEFQAFWSSKCPSQYSPIEIIPDLSQERNKPETQDAVMTFSMGVDGCFTAWRYNKPDHDLLPYPLKAGLLVHGFDFPPQHEDTFNRAIQRARIMLDSLGMTLIPMTTNLRTINHPMESRHGAFLISCLILLQGKYAAGMIGSSYPYTTMQLSWGSNPLTDRMLSSKYFPIIHDGAGFTRVEKVAYISEWTEAIQNLRVCIRREADKRDKNCCRCEKCIRTILELRALDLEIPGCFEHDVTNRQILKMRISEDVLISKFYNEILEVAKSRRTSASWSNVLKLSILKNDLIIRIKKLPGIYRLRCRTNRRQRE